MLHRPAAARVRTSACISRRSTSASTRASTPQPSKSFADLAALLAEGAACSFPPSSPADHRSPRNLPRIAAAQAAVPPKSFRHYVISGATSAEDVLRVLWLARIGGVRVEGSPIANRPRPAARPALRVHRRSAERAGRHAASSGPSPATSRCSNPGATGRRSCSATPTPTRTAA